MKIGFNRPTIAGKEFAYIREALENHHISGDGLFTRRCHAWLREQTGAPGALLTHFLHGGARDGGLALRARARG